MGKTSCNQRKKELQGKLLTYSVIALETKKFVSSKIVYNFETINSSTHVC